MKLTRLRLDQLKQFRQPLEIRDLTDGINLFVGPNESGKSTLVRAIRAAFFERYKSSSVDDLQPWGDTSATPEIELEFDWQGKHWTLNKRFLGKKRCDLKVGSQHFSGEEAEEKLAEMLGYQFPKRGGSKAEHWGIPGLLWVEQGAVQDIQGPVNHAGEHLQSALGQSLGEVASTGGDELIARVEKERAELLTTTGKETKDYKKVLEDYRHSQERLDALNQSVEQYRQQVDQLGVLIEQKQTVDAARPWEEQRRKADAAKRQLSEVQRWQSEQRQDQQALDTCRQSQAVYRQQLQDFENQQHQLTQRAEDKAKAEAQLQECRARRPQLEKRRADAEQAYERARSLREQARHQAERARLQQQIDELAERQRQQADALKQANELQAALKELHTQQPAKDIDPTALAQLKRTEQALAELVIRQKALATRLNYELEPEQSITVGEETVTGEGETLLVEATELHIPGIGRLRIQPGGTDVADLLRQQEALQSEQANLRRRLDVASFEEGEQRAAESQRLAQAIKREQARLDILAPKGVDALRTTAEQDVARLEALRAQWAQLPEVQADVTSEENAEADLEAARAELKRAEDALNQHQQQQCLAEQASANAHAEWDKLNAELQAPDRKAREERANKELTELKAREHQLTAAIDARQKQIDAAQPEVLEQDIERFTKSANAMETQARERAQSIRDLQVRLEEQGAQGLEEKRDEEAQINQRLAQRRDELTRRARALDLLLNLLKDKRQALTRQLQAPLQKHLNHYLKLLFPQAHLSVDENLMPTTLTRPQGTGEEQGDLPSLSYGAREQMGLISRLAYADLLREAGKPTLIILDDALVHSDAQRLDQMKRILFDAARRHQVLLFSCHPENWRDLGATPRDLQGLKVGDSL
ncbi:ATP-binding protein [Marinimicrobium sp. LS-A18]|uniref:AAA family ATPase n=1 Tax=Marinimicrobium sp. LS-A18 TaxID=1381596 RepID=UPI0004638252|nr:ATP-binding protein [Marinimicrobium sp. LS-A18]